MTQEPPNRIFSFIRPGGVVNYENVNTRYHDIGITIPNDQERSGYYGVRYFNNIFNAPAGSITFIKGDTDNMVFESCFDEAEHDRITIPGDRQVILHFINKNLICLVQSYNLEIMVIQIHDL